MAEEWRDIDDFPGYQVSSEGRVRSLPREVACFYATKQVPDKILTPQINRDGYYQVGIYKDGIQKKPYIHRLVGVAFISNPDNKPTVDHINRIRTDNSVSNLRWATQQEQIDNSICPPSNTGHKYIHLTPCKTYKVQRYKTYKTLEEAIAARDQFYTEI
jgi:hypothetical protein